MHLFSNFSNFKIALDRCYGAWAQIKMQPVFNSTKKSRCIILLVSSLLAPLQLVLAFSQVDEQFLYTWCFLLLRLRENLLIIIIKNDFTLALRLHPTLNSQYSINIYFSFDSVRHSESYSIILTQIVLIETFFLCHIC